MFQIRILGLVTLFFALSFNSVIAGSFYYVGKNAAETTAQSAWNNFDQDCGNADRFMVLVADSADRVGNTLGKYTQYGASAVEDFGSGYIQGLTGVLEDVVNKCTEKCMGIGKLYGDVSAGIFCNVSEAIGHTAGFKGLEDVPDITCGEPYRTGCESKFYTVAKDTCSSYAQGSTFERYYKAKYNGCCSYNPKRY